MAAFYGAVDFPSTLKSGKFTAEDFGVDKRNTGPFQLSNFISNLSKNANFNPRDPSFKIDADQGLRNLNYDDLRAQYDNQVQAIDIGTVLKAADWNSMNSFLYKVMCPVQITNNMNFSFNDIEVYQAPFDRVNPLNIGRVAGYRRTFYQSTLEMYKRSMEAEGTLLADPVHGPRAITMMKTAINNHFELTLMILAISAAIEIPYGNLLRKYADPNVGFNHTRQEIYERENVYRGAENPEAFYADIMQRISDANKADLLIIPTGTNLSLAYSEMGVVERKELMGWEPYYNPQSREMMLREAHSGVVPSKTLNVGNGRSLNILELSKFKGYSDDPDDLLRQPLRGNLTHGEYFQSPLVDLDDMVGNPSGVSAKAQDLLAPVQTPTVLTFGRVSFAQRLRTNVLFLDANGRTMDGVDADLSPYYKNGLVEKYNSTPTIKEHFKKAFRSAEHSDNDNAWSGYLHRNAKLENMSGFRHFDGFLSWDDEGDQVVVPDLLGDIEPKTMPSLKFMQMAKIITRELRGRHASSQYHDQTVPFAVYKLFKDSFPTCKINLDDVNVAANMTPIMEDMTRWANPGEGLTVRSERERRNFNFFSHPISSSKLAARDVLAPQANEALDQYLGRLTPGALHAAIDNENLDVQESIWGHLLQHVPDEALGSLLKLAYHAQQPGSSNPTAAELAAITKLGQTLEEKSGLAHVSAILAAAVSAVEGHPTKNVGAAVAERSARPWLSSRAETKANEEGPKQATLAAKVKDAVDQVEAFPTSKVGSFAGVYTEVKKGMKPPALAQQYNLKNNEIWKDRERQLLNSGYETLLERFVYVLLLCCKFNFVTCDALSKFGLGVFRQTYLRLFIYQAADAVILLPAGPSTFFLAVGHAMVTSGTNAAENSWAMHAQMHAGVIPAGGAKNIDLIPYAIPREHFSGRTLEPIRHAREILVSTARDRRSLITLPSPLTETRYDSPLSIFREAAYRSPDSRSVLAARKISITDALTEFIGDDTVTQHMVENDAIAQYYRLGPPMATQAYRAATYHPSSTNPSSNIWALVPGEGPLNKEGRCHEDSLKAFSGLGAFASSLAPTRVL